MKHTQHLNDWKQSPSGLRWNWFIHRLREEKKELDEIPFPEATKIEYIVHSYCLIGGFTRRPDVKYEFDVEQKEFVKNRNGVWFGFWQPIETNSSYLDLMFQIEDLMRYVRDRQHCCVSPSLSYDENTNTISVWLDS